MNLLHRSATITTTKPHITRNDKTGIYGAPPSVSSSLFTTSLGCLLYVLDFLVVVVLETVVLGTVGLGVFLWAVTDHQAGFVIIGGGVVRGVEGGPHTLNTIFMLWVVQRPPILRCRSSLVEVEIK